MATTLCDSGGAGKPWAKRSKEDARRIANIDRIVAASRRYREGCIERAMRPPPKKAKADG